MRRTLNAPVDSPLPTGLSSEQRAKAIFARHVQQLMAEHGMKQADLQRRINEIRGKELNRSSMSRYISGKQMPSKDVVHAIAQIFRVREDDLVPFQNVPQAGIPEEVQAWENMTSGKAHIRLSMIVSQKTAHEIWALIREDRLAEEAGRAPQKPGSTRSDNSPGS